MSRAEHAARRAPRLLAAALAVGALLAPVRGRAHDFWVERAGDGFVVRYGHVGGASLPIDAAQLKAIRCGDGARWTDVRARAVSTPEAVRFSGACAVVSVLQDGGIWTLTPDGEVNLPRSQVAHAVRSWASRQHAKWVDATSAAAREVLGDELELVPVSDLAKARVGDKVTVRVLSAGRPVVNAPVEVADRVLGETDSKGELRLRLRATGLESISTTVRHPAATREADVDIVEASLTFEVRR